MIAVLPPTFNPSCPLEGEIGESLNDQYIHDTTVTACVFPWHAQTTPLSEQQEVLFPWNFGTLVLLSQGGGMGYVHKVLMV